MNVILEKAFHRLKCRNESLIDEQSGHEFGNLGNGTNGILLKISSELLCAIAYKSLNIYKVIYAADLIIQIGACEKKYQKVMAAIFDLFIAQTTKNHRHVIENDQTKLKIREI